MPSTEEFDSTLAQDQERLIKKCREQLRQVIENAAAEQGIVGAVTAWIVVAEVASREDDQPVKSLFIDHAYHDNTCLVPWAFNGLLDYASAVVNS